jgi:FkbM family methyltransferase
MNKQEQKRELESLLKRNINKNAPLVSDIMNSMKNKHIFIYGAGSFGKEMFEVFKEYNINVCAFLDIKAEKGDMLFNIPVYRADDFTINESVKQDALVLFSIVTYKKRREKIVEYIKKCGFKNIINSQSIRCRFVKAEKYPYEKLGQDYLESRLNDILDCMDLWSDMESVRVYKSNVYSHISRNYEECIESEGNSQYFLMDLKFNKGFSRFIDCGGYIGDTLTELVKTQGKINAIASFEPNSKNFIKLSKTADAIRSDINELYLYPCGVSDKTEILSFNMLGGSSSISDAGSSYIQCVSLDDVLKGFAPTFIKMDIEGEEYKALIGAKKLIEEHKPDMAICLYHYINHLWDIPLLINSWNLGYKFYLRAHNACTMETVMYATSNR